MVNRLCVPLSGGIDSSVVLALAVQAVGKYRVLPVTMPARPGDPSLKAAALMRSCLGFAECDPLHEFDIEPIVDSFRAQMERFTGRLHLGESYAQQTQEQKIRSGNFASRVRIAVLYDWLRSIRGRVLGTDNRTEH